MHIAVQRERVVQTVAQGEVVQVHAILIERDVLGAQVVPALGGAHTHRGIAEGQLTEQLAVPLLQGVMQVRAKAAAQIVREAAGERTEEG